MPVFGGPFRKTNILALMIVPTLITINLMNFSWRFGGLISAILVQIASLLTLWFILDTWGYRLLGGKRPKYNDEQCLNTSITEPFENETILSSPCCESSKKL
jgi:hypothetical protein